MILPQSEFAHGNNTRLPKNTQPGELDMLLPPAERVKEGTPTWHHTDTFSPSSRMNDQVRAYFTELGSSEVGKLGFRDNWVFLGAKGLMSKSPFEKVHAPPHELCSSILFMAPPKLHLTHLSAEDEDQCRNPPGQTELKLLLRCKLATSSFILPLSFFLQHIKNDKETNKYDGWPELLEMEGCAPRKMD